MNEECPFCKQLKFCKETDEYVSQSRKHSNYRHEYRAALDCANYYTDYNDEEWCTGGATYGGYPLNFCPTCGKDLREKN